MTFRQIPLSCVLLSSALLSACAAPLPVYSPMPDADALQIIADRLKSITSISGECDLTLTSPDGRSVRLEGALVAQPPDRVRLRAWKFGHAVFDLTLIDNQAWAMLPEDENASQFPTPPRLPAKGMGDALDLLGPAFFRSARVVSSTSSILRVEGRALGRDDVMCEIDRPTLTPRRFLIAGGSRTGTPPDDAPDLREIRLDEYTLVNDIPWASRLRLQSPSGDILVRFRDVELNAEVPAEAFVPPTRAKRLQ